MRHEVRREPSAYEAVSQLFCLLKLSVEFDGTP